jgi:hypothetical protein
MTQFTDDDLKRLKGRYTDVCECGGNHHLSPHRDELIALLARLEASERVCEALRRYLVNQEHDDFDLALIAWRKAAGK